MNKKEPIFPKNWGGSKGERIGWASPGIQENICPKCHHYGGRFKHDGVCQFCGYEVEIRAEFEACGKKVIKYNHYGNDVFVLKDKKGQHREHCLCWHCGSFYPEPEDMNKNCSTARLLYNICVRLGMVVFAWECPLWIPPRADQLDEKE